MLPHANMQEHNFRMHARIHNVNVMSYNVTTLFPAHEDRAYSRIVGQPMGKRVQLLELDLHHHNCHIAGLQEGRSRNSRVRRGVFYEMYEAGADSGGCDGVQVWISLSLAFKRSLWRAISPRTVFVAGVF